MMIKLGFEQRPLLLFPNESALSKPIVWLGDYAFNSKSDSRMCGCSVSDESMKRFCGLMRNKLGFEQCPGLLFKIKTVLSKLIVWMGDYAFNSKSYSRLCGCSVFDYSISRLCGLMRVKLGFEQRPGLLFPNRSVLSKPIVWLGDYSFNSKSDSRLCGCSVFD